jgi:hypothetical protein
MSDEVGNPNERAELMDRIRDATDLREYITLLKSFHESALVETYGPEIISVSRNDEMLRRYVVGDEPKLQKMAFDCLNFIRYRFDERIFQKSADYIKSGNCNDIKFRCIMYLISAVGNRNDEEIIEVLLRCAEVLRTSGSTDDSCSTLKLIQHSIQLLRGVGPIQAVGPDSTPLGD